MGTVLPVEPILDVKRKWFWVAVGLVGAGALTIGLSFHQWLAAGVIAAWCGIEIWDRRGADAWGVERKGNGGRLSPLSSLLAIYSRSDEASETLLFEKISDLRVEAELTESESRWLERLKDLMTLRALVFGKTLSGKKGLRQAFTYRFGVGKAWETSLGDELSLQDVTESATVVADLYWKLYDTGQGEYQDLTKMARRLFTAIFAMEFEADGARERVEALADAMQRHGGLPFLIVSCLRRGETERARFAGQLLLSLVNDVDEDVRSSFYWIAEIEAFMRRGPATLVDYDSTIRYLYHLCFTNPDRAGFLEIDSRFFSQFETVNELAREGFLFKDTLIEKVLATWGEYEGLFDGVFQSVLEALTGRKSKIYNERENWIRFWNREGESFSRDALYVVEGNLAYSAGFLEDAVAYYEKALGLNARSRPARLNLLFAYAKLGRSDRHEALATRLAGDSSLHPSALSVIGNSYLLLGDEQTAEAYYSRLEAEPGWATKADYYKSTFCYENGLFEKALEFARRAFRRSPSDSRVRYHLSLCYNAMGEKDEALAMVSGLDETPQWLNYYRFTLERDAGRPHEASRTLLKIPSSYFEDPDEWSQALEFARGQKDLTLLRHLKRR